MANQRWAPVGGPGLAAALERGRAVLSRIELPEIELQLRRSHPGGLPGPPTLKGSSVMVALGALIALFGLRLETYELTWYQDVRAILLVGLGSIFAVAGVQRAVLALRGWMGARESH